MDGATTNQWVIRRTGLIDFWYYDNQEFFWEDGRLLLRGTNGSGKSVTMQLFLPLLMDGNRSPSRLDPFQGRDRRLDNYMLEEDDEREDRVGYLYMQFAKNDEIFTIGLGARARKHQSLDVWYFCAGGRSVGQNLQLVKHDRVLGDVCLTKAELRAELPGGVFDSQQEYMREVNRALFGFPSVDDYKGLLDLIVQLRSPKLSKDFKPSVVLEILSDSLPPLTDAELRPLSEAIENMDNQKDRLSSISESFRAVRLILNAYRHYNRLMMTGKLRAYVAALREADKAEEAAGALAAGKAETENDILLNNETIERLRVEYGECESIISELSEKHEAEAEATKKLTRLKLEAESAAESLAKKRADISAKKTRMLQSATAAKTLEAEADWRAGKLGEALAELGELADEAAFDDHGSLASAFNGREGFDFAFIKEGIKRHDGELRGGLGLLVELERLCAERDGLNERLESSGEALGRKNAEFATAEAGLEGMKLALAHAVEDWAAENTRLMIRPEITRRINRAIGDYAYTDERLRIGGFVEDLMNALRGAIDQRVGAKKVQINNLNEAKNAKQAEIRRLRELEEIEPERPEGAARAREYLLAHGIPHAPFYKLLKFKPGVSETAANRIEESLWRMGVLDALVVPEKYREAVMRAADGHGGMAEKYMFIFDKLQKLDKNYDLTSVLEIDGETGLETLIDNALKAVYYGVESHTTVNETGVYRLGALTGTLSGDYVSKYIGEAARERNRQESIHALQIEIEGLVKQISVCEADIDALRLEAAKLAEEHGRMPQTGGLAEIAAKMRALDMEAQIARSENEGISERLAPVKKAIHALNARLAGQSGQLRLPPDIKVYNAALENMRQYGFGLTDLIDGHNGLLANIEKTANEKDRLESLEEDLDGLLYDEADLGRRQNSLNAEINGINERLRVSGYEEVVQTIGDRRRRIEEIRNCLDILQKTSGALESKLRRLGEDIEAAAQAKAQRALEAGLVKRALADESALGYTDAAGLDVDDRASVNKALNQLELGKRDFAGRSAEDMEKEVHNRLFDNLHNLSEYAPKEEELFEQSAGIPLKIKRVDIVCMADGRKIGLETLYARMEREIEIQRELIKESDRKLFEEVLGQTLALEIANKIGQCESWVKKIDKMMKSMNTSSGLSLGLGWVSRKAGAEDEMDSGKLVGLLKKDARERKDEDFEKISAHFSSRINQARKAMEDSGRQQSLHSAIGEILDYRRWFDFQLYYAMAGERRRELTNRAFSQFSGGEKAMSMYVPLFCAIAAKYDAAGESAPRVISLDEAFAGVDDRNIGDMFRLMVSFGFNFIINSQSLWGDYETVPKLAIYDLHRPANAKFVAAVRYVWNGRQREVVLDKIS